MTLLIMLCAALASLGVATAFVTPEPFQIGVAVFGVLMYLWLLTAERSR